MKFTKFHETDEEEFHYVDFVNDDWRLIIEWEQRTDDYLQEIIYNMECLSNSDGNTEFLEYWGEHDNRGILSVDKEDLSPTFWKEIKKQYDDYINWARNNIDEARDGATLQESNGLVDDHIMAFAENGDIS